MRDLISSHAEMGQMLFRSLADLYESLQAFTVFEQDGKIVGCCSLIIIWADLAEVKSLAVHKDYQSKGIGSALVSAIVEQAKNLSLPKIFTLTLEKRFFEKMGFEKVPMSSLPHKVWSDCVNCPKQDCCDEIAMILNLPHNHP